MYQVSITVHTELYVHACIPCKHIMHVLYFYIHTGYTHRLYSHTCIPVCPIQAHVSHTGISHTNTGTYLHVGGHRLPCASLWDLCLYLYYSCPYLSVIYVQANIIMSGLYVHGSAGWLSQQRAKFQRGCWGAVGPHLCTPWLPGTLFTSQVDRVTVFLSPKVFWIHEPTWPLFRGAMTHSFWWKWPRCDSSACENWVINTRGRWRYRTWIWHWCQIQIFAMCVPCWAQRPHPFIQSPHCSPPHLLPSHPQRSDCTSLARGTEGPLMSTARACRLEPPSTSEMFIFCICVVQITQVM